MQFNQPLRLPSHFTKPVFAMTLRQQVLLLHQATFALEKRNISPRMPRLDIQQHTQMLITAYICDLPATHQVCIPANRGSEGDVRATVATYVLERGSQDMQTPSV